MQLSAIRDYLEGILNIPTGDSFIDSTYELQLIQKGYDKTAYLHDWPQFVKRDADVLIANVDRYDLPSDFRKMEYLFVNGQLHEPTSLRAVHYSPLHYTIVHDSSEYIFHTNPTSASTAYTLADNETAGSAVVIGLDTVDGLAAGDQIWINDSTSSEFTKIQSVDTDNTTITAKLANNHSSGIILYKLNEVAYFAYSKQTATLANTTDVPETPTSTHTAIAHYAAYLFYKDINETENAQNHLDIWKDEVEESWLAFDKSSTGEANEFTI